MSDLCLFFEYIIPLSYYHMMDVDTVFRHEDRVAVTKNGLIGRSIQHDEEYTNQTVYVRTYFEWILECTYLK